MKITVMTEVEMQEYEAALERNRLEKERKSN